MERGCFVRSKVGRALFVPWAGRLHLTTVLMLLLTTSAWAQAGTIAGRVVDEQGTPVALAQVAIAGTNLGAVTDQDGNFRIVGIPQASVRLRVTMIGFRPSIQTFATDGSSVIIQLARTAISLDEIVVTGTAGGQQRRELGNTVGTIEVTDVQGLIPQKDVTSLLNGRAPGVQITPGTGMVGAGPRVRIRGSASLSLTDQPLLYVDGVRVNNNVQSGPLNQGYGSASISRLGDFDPDDIESIEIIRGPAAATLYGTEASNGVIQIITKKGRYDSPTQWDLTIRQGANWFDNAANRVPTNWGLNDAGQLTEVNLIQQEADRGTPVFRTGRVQEYGLSVRGGSTNVRYFVSGAFEDAEGIDVNNNVSRYTVRSNLGFTASEKWDLNVSVGYVKADIGLADDIGAGILFNSMFSGPNVALDTPRRGFLRAPPEVLHQLDKHNQQLDRFTGSIQVQHTPASFFTHRLTIGLDNTFELNTTDFTPFLDPEAAAFFSPTSALGRKFVDQVSTEYNTLDYNATLSLDLSNTMRSTTSVGVQYYRTLTELLDLDGRQFTGPGLSTISGTALTTSGEDRIENVTLGTFLQEQIGLNDRLFFTGAVRIDNNSAFGSDFSLVAYPKFSASWVISEEPFFGWAFLNTLRLRTAFGQSGQQPQAFAALRSFKPVTIGGGEGGVTPQFVGNPALSPERATEFEFGFEAGMFDERVGIDFTVYHQRIKDAILLRTLAPSGGFPGSMFINIGELQNQGMELQLKAALFQGESFGWDAEFNLAYNGNKVIDVSGAKSGTTPQGEDFIRFGTNLDTPGIHLRHQEGKPAGSYFGRRIVSAELDAGGTAINQMCDGGEVSATPVPCDGAPDVFLGRTDPNVDGAFITSFTLFRDFTLSGLLDFKLGVHHGENDTLVRCSLFQTCEANFRPEKFDPVFVAQAQSASLSTYAVADASFWKLRDVSLAYRLPPSAITRLGASRGSVTLSLRNIYTWTPWTSIDPETFFIINQFDKWSQTFTPHPMSFLATVSLTY